MHNENIELLENLHEHWLLKDSLFSVKYDLCFTMGTRYFCDAGCKVCYIADNLKEMRSTAMQYFPTITDKHEEIWEQVFSHFEYLHTDDDMMYLKLNHPKHYDWFKRNAHRFEYGMTDNAIFRFSKHVVNDIKFKQVGNVAISSFFAERVSKEKLVGALDKIKDTMGLKQIKLIDVGNINALKFYYDYANKHGIETLFHYDLNSPKYLIKEDWINEQITWIDTNPNTKGIMQIYGNEAVQLSFDRFYFSNDASSGTVIEPYHILEDKFNPEEFLYDLVIGKQRLYNEWITKTENTKFKSYYETALKYIFHKDFNFIPGPMMPPRSKFCSKMIENGWVKIEHGLFKPANEVKPFVSIKNEFQ
jgi:hypothetical protein